MVSLRLSRVEFRGLKLPPGVMKFISTRIVSLILQRVRRGIDLDGSPFPPYSADYARRRSLAGLGTEPRLLLTGAMLRSLKAIRVDESGLTARIGVEGSAPTARIGVGRRGERKAARRARDIPGGGTRKTQTMRIIRGPRTVSNAEKAAGLQSGTNPRTFIGLTDAEAKQLETELAAWVRSRLG